MNASQALAEARLRAGNADMEGAIRLLSSELATFTGDLEDRRRMVALVLTYCGRSERFEEGMRIAVTHLQLDPPSVIDSSIKARLVMNYAALKAALGDVDYAKALLGELLLCSEQADVSGADISRISTMLESLRVATAAAPSSGAGLHILLNDRSQAYLASAHVSRLMRDGSFSEATRLSRVTLASQVGLEDGPLKVALMLNLGSALAGEGKAGEAEDWLRRSYYIAARCLTRSGTLFALVARSYAASLAEAGKKRRAGEVLQDLLEEQLAKFGDAHPEVIATRRQLQ